MKPVTLSTVLLLSASFIFTGCLGLNLGGGTKNETRTATLGQQLVDLQRAKDSGAISDGEFQAQKAKLLGH